MWGLLWTLLVLGTVSGAFWLGTDLWRRSKAVAQELERAAAVLEQLDAKVAALDAAREKIVVPVGFQDPDAARERRLAQADVRFRRRERRLARDRRTVERWRQVTR